MLHLERQGTKNKFDAKSDEGIILGYCSNNRACGVYNKRTMTVMESINVRFDDYLPPIKSFKLEDPPMGFLHEEGNILNIPKYALPSSDGESGPISIDAQTILESEHPVS